jgi:tetratricopeptide (TPR) repeat protein
LNSLILRLLEKRPEDRPADANEVATMLRSMDEKESADAMAHSATAADELSLLDRIVRGKMVGRDREFREASSLWQRVSGGEGHVLLISGEPGIGKTRFARELVALAEVSGNITLRGTCYPEGGAPYAPLAQILRSTLGAEPRLFSNLQTYILADLISLAPDLATMFPDIPPNPVLDVDSEQQRIFESFLAYCRAHIDRRPTLLFIDDAHWADSGSLRLLLHLARRTRNLPLLIMISYREVELDESRPLHSLLHDLYRERLATRIKIARLSAQQTQQMLEAMFAEHLDPEFVEGIYRETEGNPFYIEEVCKALIEDGKLQFEQGRWNRPRMDQLYIPQSIRLAIQARVGRLPDEAQETLRLGAILGREFDFETLQAASGEDEDQLIHSLELALKVQLIQEVRHDGRISFAFVHALIPSTLRESLSILRRQRLHRRAARVIEKLREEDYEDLAYHYAQAGDADRARSYYVQAGERAEGLFATSDAGRYYKNALELWPDEDPRGRANILRKLGGILLPLDDITGAIKATEEARDIYQTLGETVSVGAIEVALGWLHWGNGDRQASLEHHHRSIAILERGEESEEFAIAVSQISRMHMLAAEYDQAIEWGERALEMADRLGADEVKAHVLNNLGVSHAQTGNPELGISQLSESLRLALNLSGIGESLRAYHNLSEILVDLSRHAEARELIEDYIRHSDNMHAQLSASLGHLFLTHLDWITGRWKVSLQRRELAEMALIGVWDVWKSFIFGRIDNDLGRYELVCEEMENLHDRAIRADEVQTTVPFLGQLARAYAGRGLEEQATQTIHQYTAMLDENPFLELGSIESLRFANFWFASARDTRSIEEIERCVARMQRAHDQFGVPLSKAALAESRGLLAMATGKVEEAISNFSEAISNWGSINYIQHQAKDLLQLGRIYSDAQRPEEAQQAFQRADQIFSSLADQVEDRDLRRSFKQTPEVEEAWRGSTITA